MGYVLGIRCGSCRYRTGGVVGNGKNILALCRQCRNVINPKTVPFRLDPPPCPLCGAATPLGEPWPKSCPLCAAPLEYDDSMHFSMFVVDRYPPIGAMVHVWAGHPADRVRWEVPDVWLRKGEVIMFDAPDEVSRWRYGETTVHEAEVIALDTSTDGNVTAVYLSYRGVATIGSVAE